MLTPYLVELLAAFRVTELRREAYGARLTAIATCCRPSAWARAARRAGDAVLRLRTAVGRDPVNVCCTV